MLANGAKLGYKKKGAGEDYTDLTSVIFTGSFFLVA